MQVIQLFTDFGFEGPYVGEMKAVFARAGLAHKVIDLMHDVPTYNIQSASILLNALATRFQPGDACLAIVDPGVGSVSRRPVLLELDGIIYCGPDNGLFGAVADNASAIKSYEIRWRPENLSNSFHGRDLFAPALIKYLNKEYGAFTDIDATSLIGFGEQDELDTIIYIDKFGNAISGRSAKTVSIEDKLKINKYTLNYADTFSSVTIGEAFWYINSMGLVEIAVNQGNAKERFKLEIGSAVKIN